MGWDTQVSEVAVYVLYYHTQIGSWIYPTPIKWTSSTAYLDCRSGINNTMLGSTVCEVPPSLCQIHFYSMVLRYMGTLSIS